MTDFAAEHERFQRDTAEHEMTVVHDDGLHRHLRFAHPRRSAYWFEIVTWPGSLAIRGDMGGGHVFSRSQDMFEFFRSNSDDARINPSYWAEKLQDGRRSVQEYSQEVLAAAINECLVEYKAAFPGLVADYQVARAAWDKLPHEARWPRGTEREPREPLAPEGVRQMVSHAERDGETEREDGARDLLQELEQTGVVSDTWEWNLSDWSWPFLWCCHAIVWGIRQYDEAKRGAMVAR